ncbi:ligase-associated DNA damage response DEXH box helicase [Rurimicrobium arvi]|uniref:Ligase-associated DNA damage response DEXH box helicase n=1 Tax=Rurimicrobium arvi TaxID=2049916 RepID=A0ABP8MVE8_9BACT
MSKAERSHPIALEYFTRNNWQAHDFQKACWDAIAKGYSGLLNAPTGFGKTHALWFGILQQYFDHHRNNSGLHCLWLTPLRALSKEIFRATQRVSDELGLDYSIGLRTGDTTASEKAKQRKKLPNGLISTPESLHLMLAQKGYPERLGSVQIVVIDEWYELVGSKRGVQVALALTRLRALNPDLMIWGISATIGNLDEAIDILLGSNRQKSKLISTPLHKRIEIETLIPEKVEEYPWGGHLGVKMLPKVLPVIAANHSTLIFTNTRSQCEIWYQRLLDAEPDLAGQIAIHHGSLGEDLRLWVEDALHEGKLKAVVCTSSLDLGVDFRPVDAVIQIGSPKGIARFMQRAGRSGHQPGALSKIYFVPTHSLEIVEGSALRTAIAENRIEQRIPYIRSFDVLIQYMVTLAVSEGFDADRLYDEVTTCFCYQSVTREEFNWCLDFVVHGGKQLGNYDEFHKVVKEDGLYRVTSKRVAMRHRMSIGTIVSDNMMQVKFLSGGRIGSIEEWFIARLKPGDSFWFAGRNLELVRIKDMTAFVRKSNAKKGVFPSWEGGKMPLSSQLTETIRNKIDQHRTNAARDIEIEKLKPLFEEQEKRSLLPHTNDLLIETARSQEGYHLFVYPFEGRNVHEGMAMLFSYRISQIQPMSFSISMNDYGFELLSDQEIPIAEALQRGLFSTDNLSADIQQSVNIAEMARRRFRDIAHIAGLIFSGYPGEAIKTRHIQASAQLFFSVFEELERNNLLLQQAFDEVMTFQMEEQRLRNALLRMQEQQAQIVTLQKFSPFCFPILTERFREKFSNEKLEDRIRKMLKHLEE